jgi:2-iminoacetate synthase
MDLAKPGKIKRHCEPNGLSTFQEYLLDFASEQTRREGEQLISRRILEMPPAEQMKCAKMINQVRHGERDVFV